MEKSEGNAVGEGRAVVDAQAPFRSAKEAVMLFGVKVLVGEIYANRLKEMQAQAIEANLNSKLGAVTTELNEEKKSLKVAREEANDMAYNLESLKEELHQTRRELQQLKAKAKKVNEKRAINVEIDQQLKFVGNSARENATEFQVKKLVRFESPGSLVPRIEDKAIYMIEGQGKKKKKGFHALGWISQGREVVMVIRDKVVISPLQLPDSVHFIRMWNICLYMQKLKGKREFLE